jgi:2-iminobutanoate/2-iminopropanoate deaminase
MRYKHRHYKAAKNKGVDMSQGIKKVETPGAPKALGPYSQGIIAGKGESLVFVSGQLPIDPGTGKLVEGDIRIFTKQVIDNLEAILLAAGSSLELVVRTDVFLKDLKNFSMMNEEYAKRFGQPAPARQTIQVSDLPLGAPIEISCIAVVRQ